ncbi:DUF58 domain-containing protein [Sphingorhabdus soli]|uniref:DUF58 domain-containing protein n=1 Tax=Flavisphingopyxis soli TaxID=2601267 RepID=A0A5C6U923_9SPHN|nr:DUF58 domain-containing protein [Sphingorhabdus soli]TXC68306.1 DUF58 domain-containing protein [Sphingorhabdus soli]
MIYPARRAAWLAAAAALPALGVALLLPASWYLGLLPLCLLTAFIVVDAVSGVAPVSVAPRVALPAMIGVGTHGRVILGADFARGVPRRIEGRIATDARLRTIGDSDAMTIDDRSATLAIPFEAVRRGQAAVARLWLRWPGAFGLVWKQTSAPVDRAIAVIPDLETLRSQALRYLQEAAPGEQDRRRRGQGREFEALREYQPGMGRRSIDWKRSARHGELLAREYRTDHNQSVVLAIDSGRLMCEPVAGMPKVDRAVGAALLTAFMALKGGDSVRLFGFDSRPRVASGAMSGVAGFSLLQQRAAEIDYSPEETNFTLALTTLGARLERRSLVVIFTDFVDSISAELMLRNVGALTRRHLVLFVLMRDAELEAMADAEPASGEDVARAVTAGALLRERQLVIERLRLLGVEVIEATHDEIGPALLERYLTLKREDRL